MDRIPDPNVRVGHLCLEVSNVVEARRFYEPVLKNLGFKVVLEDKDTIGLSNGAFAIFLSKPEHQRIERKSPREEDYVIADHIALLVPDRKTVNDVADSFEREGFKPLFAPEEHPEFRAGYYSASFCDPDNNVIEFYTIIE